MLKQKIQGFSLVEVMITLSIMAIMIGFSVPALKNMIESNRLQSAVDDFQFALVYSRLNAISLQMDVAICPKKPAQIACEDDVNEQDYAEGWLVFSDCDDDGVFDNSNVCDRDLDGSNDASELLKIYDLNKKNALSITGDVKYKDLITYQLTGRTTEGAGEFTFSTNLATSKLKVSRIGMIMRE
ncbi:MAG: Unknown protein [uncultured Thiotrichaceae bacterium]|uniref:Type II secretion system protein H n=1 Tax=uncultured Thiotrichaceae bacterium TaxID=298394 RepID=A0A6S6S138_9GAMM|nr:MAG: Unknown protein [uncultured Thiotrichaceae bacterium]